MSWSADRPVRRAAARAVAVLACAVAATLTAAGSASAHAELVSSNPANGATLATPPANIALHFDEEIAARFSSARLVDGTGEAVADVGQRISADGRTLSLSLAKAAMPDGSYGVLWRVVAEDDGHGSGGAIAFSVGAAGAAGANTAAVTAPSPPIATPSASPVDAARRGLGILALSLVIGGLAVAGLILPRGATAASGRRRVLRLVAGAAAAGLVVGLADLASEVSQLNGSGAGVLRGLLTQTRWGRLWLLEELALAAVGVLAVLVLRGHGRGRGPFGIAIGGAVLTLATAESLGSHAAAQSGVAVAVLTVHVLAACTWVGALPALAVLLWRGPGPGRLDGRQLLRDSRFRLSWLLGTTVCILIATGLYSAGWGVTQLTAITSTGYGQVLLVKVGLVLVVLAVAAANSARLHGVRTLRSVLPRVRPSTRRSLSARTLGLEIGALLLVVGATGVLVESPPARGTSPLAASPIATARPATSGVSSGDLVLSLVVSPNQPGLNAFSVRTKSTRRPDPGLVEGVVLKLDQAGATSTVPLRENAPGQFFGLAQLASTNPSGASPVGVTLELTRGSGSTTVHLPWSVSPVPPVVAPRPRPAPPRRTAPYADALALVVLALGLLAATLGARRHRPRAPTRVDPPASSERQLELSR